MRSVMCFTNVKRIIVIILALSLSACSANLDEAFEKTDEFIVQILESGKNIKEYKIRRGTEKYLKFEKWARDNEWGWSPTPATYVPGVVVKSGDYHFNFIGDGVVLNNPEGQYSKDINKNEYEYFY